MRRNSGLSLIELMVTMMISLVIAGGLFKVFVDTTTHHVGVIDANDAETMSRQPLDTLVDHMRGAQAVEIGGTYQAIKSGTATSVEYYFLESSTDVVKYFLDGTDLKRLEGGVTTVEITDVQSLEFRYYLSASTRYYSNGTIPATDINAPTSAELPLIAKIEVVVDVTSGGFTRQLVGDVRLRNSPFKKRI